MYLFRALNDDEEKQCRAGNGIVRTTQTCDFRSLAIPHIRGGSNGIAGDCWISLSKDFTTCVEEYAIPQLGRYNTTDKRKSVAVINTGYWKKLDNNKDIYKTNLTVFLEEGKEIKGLNLSDTSIYPDLEVMGNRRYIILPDNKRALVCEKVMNIEANHFKRILKNKIYDIDSGLLDCSMPHLNKVPVIQEFSLCNLSPKGKKQGYNSRSCGILTGNVASAIERGSASLSKEVLCLYSVPQKAIEYILSPLEQDVLFMIPNEQNRNNVVEELAQGILSIKLNNNVISVTRNNQMVGTITVNPAFYSGLLVNLLSASSSNIEYDYRTMLDAKKTDLTKVVALINNSYVSNIGSIPEEKGMFVLDLDTKNTKVTLPRTKMYDCMAIKYQGNLYIGRNQIGRVSKKNLLFTSMKAKLEITPL